MAFRVIVDRYWEAIYRHVYLRIRDEEESKDIVQEIFFSLWKNRSTLRLDKTGSIASYLFKSAKYCTIDYFTRKNTKIARSVELCELLSLASETTADQEIKLKELRLVVQEELDQLPERLRVPYLLSREENLTIKEIAASLGISEQAVKNNISITLAKLRTRLKHYNSDYSALIIIIAAACRTL